MKTKSKKLKNPKAQIQGSLLMEKMVDKYEAYNTAEDELNKLVRLFSKNGRKLILSKSGDDIYYLVQNIRGACEILEKA
jgi:hypothetical protein